MKGKKRAQLCLNQKKPSIVSKEYVTSISPQSRLGDAGRRDRAVGRV